MNRFLHDEILVWEVGYYLTGLLILLKLTGYLMLPWVMAFSPMWVLFTASVLFNLIQRRLRK